MTAGRRATIAVVAGLALASLAWVAMKVLFPEPDHRSDGSGVATYVYETGTSWPWWWVWVAAVAVWLAVAAVLFRPQSAR